VLAVFGDAAGRRSKRQKSNGSSLSEAWNGKGRRLSKGIEVVHSCILDKAAGGDMTLRVNVPQVLRPEAAYSVIVPRLLEKLSVHAVHFALAPSAAAACRLQLARAVVYYEHDVRHLERF
jgi:hypothetical protein